MKLYDEFTVFDINLIEENVLGPYKRLGIWFDGCKFNCKNCIYRKESFIFVQNFNLNDLVNKIVSYNINEITFSGGEPFEQDSELFYELLKTLKEKNFGILVYSGYTFDELVEKNFLNHLKLIDILIDGRYIDELNDNQTWKGSENQNIYFFSKRYENFDFSKLNGRKLQFIIEENKIIILGIQKK